MLHVLHESRYSQKSKELAEELKNQLGKRKVSEELSDRIAYSKDFNPVYLRHLLKGTLPALPDVVVFPENAEEVSMILSLANSHGIPVYVFGGGSGVINGSTPFSGGIALSTLSMNGVEIDEENLFVRAGAGVVGGKLEYELNHRGYTLRHIPQSLYCSTVGGWVATKASGQFSTKYGNIEDVLVNLKVVMPDGEILESKTLPRKASFDLKGIFIGSEGIFGVVSEVVLKIWKIPEKQHKLAFKYESMDEAVEDAKKIMMAFKPALIRIFDRLESLKNFGIEGVVTIFIVEGDMADEERKFILENSNGEYIGDNPVDIWLKERFNVSDISKFVPLGIIFDTIEISCFWKDAMRVYRNVLKAIRDVEGVLMASCHASHFYYEGLCFYFTFAGVSRDFEKLYRQVWESAMRAAIQNGASLSHHHGIGSLRSDWLSEEMKSYYNLLRDLKRVFDRRNIMNPGKVIK